jgi:transcriptional regulator GlxA family with amidase domain
VNPSKFGKKHVIAAAALMLGLLAMVRAPRGATSEVAAPVAARAEAKNVGILLFEGVFITEFAAPFDVYKHCGDKLNVFTVGVTKDAIKTYEGVTLHPDHTIADAPKIDVLVVPSGIHSVDQDLANQPLVGFVRKTAETATWVTSHCWGAFTLANAGLLKGRECTTFPSSVDDLQKKFPDCKTRKDARFVVSDKFITSNGGLAAFEAATFVVEKLLGKADADKVAAGLVFAPQNRAYASDPAVKGSN